MAKAIIIYESRWGNTKLVAEKIAEGLQQAGGMPATVTDVKSLETDRLAGYDLVLIGSPNHIGSATRNIGSLVDKLAGLKLEGKTVAVFDTCLKGDYEKVVKKLEKMIAQKAPGLKLVTPGLSVVVDGMKGPVSQEEINKSREFGQKLAKQLKKEN
jgi:flavodoxin